MTLKVLELPDPLLKKAARKVEPGEKREYGKGSLTVRDRACPLFVTLPETLQVWNSHGDKLTKLPTGFKSVATTDNSDYAAVEHRGKKFFGLQFHPEVVHTPRGSEIIAICGCANASTADLLVRGRPPGRPGWTGRSAVPANRLARG